MKRLRPSLVRRLTLAFALSQAVAVTVILAALLPLERFTEETLGPSIATSIIKYDLAVERGQLVLHRDAHLKRLEARSPELWYLIRQGGQEIDFGPIPADVRELVHTPLATVTMADFKRRDAKGPLAIGSLIEDETEIGNVLIAAGGIDPAAVTWMMWFRTLMGEQLYLLPLILSILTFIGGLAAIPIVLRSLRPTARAAAELDGSDLQRRIPEQGVVKELVPIVRAFNAALDRLSDAFERRRRFIADVAHELRTPLAVLNMHVEDLPLNGTKPDLQRTVFRLGQMVGQMLDAERLVLAGRKHERVDLVQLAREAIAHVAPLVISNGYTPAFTSDVESFVIDGDSHAISRAISNLLGNAIAHGGGSGTIEVRVKSDGAVEVCDEGPGVPFEARERIFEPFHRERWDKDGCGLGLHLVREIMNAHGGTARVVTNGGGAVFRLEFSRQRPNIANPESEAIRSV